VSLFFPFRKGKRFSEKSRRFKKNSPNVDKILRRLRPENYENLKSILWKILKTLHSTPAISLRKYSRHQSLWQRKNTDHLQRVVNFELLSVQTKGKCVFVKWNLREMVGYLFFVYRFSLPPKLNIYVGCQRRNWRIYWSLCESRTARQVEVLYRRRLWLSELPFWFRE